MYTHNVEDYLSEAIDSLISQSLDFKDNVQLIIVDGQSEDETRNIAQKYANEYPENIIILSNDEDNIYSAYNNALNHADGDYINFMLPIDVISKNALKKINETFQKDDVEIITLPIEYLDTEKAYPLKFKFEEDSEEYVDLRKNELLIQTDVFSAFIRKSTIGGLRFTDIERADTLFINEILLKEKRYRIVQDETYYARERFTNPEDNDTIKEKIFDSFELFYNKLIDISIEKEDTVPYFIQNTMLHYLEDIISISDIEEIFTNPTERSRFWDELLNILNQLDERNISLNTTLKKTSRDFLIYLKNDEFHVETQGKEIYLKSDSYIIDLLHNRSIYFDIVKLRDGFLHISGTFSSTCDKRFISVEAIKSGKTIKEIYEAKEVEYPNTYRQTQNMLSIPWYYYYSFDLKIPVEHDESCSISLRVIYQENDERIEMDCKVNSRKYVFLSEHGNYFRKNDQIVLLKKFVLYIRPHSYLRASYYEIKALIKIILSNIPFNHRIRALFYRIVYFIAYIFMKNRKIWLFSDRINLSCDNGEHFFRYAANIKDDVKKYFVIEKNCEDYKRLRKSYGSKIVPFGSVKHKFLFMFTEKFMQSQISPVTNNPFKDFDMRLYAGLSTGENYFLQHGVARYDMSSWMTQFDKNLELVLAVSEYDCKEFTSENYNFDEDIVKILGFPRYDNLTNAHLKKQIVIMPTWRNYIKNSYQLINSEYYARFNSLINNERLIEYAKKKGYEIILKPHPLMYEFIDSFDKNDYVKIDNVTKHHEILCDSSLMITDYSSVAFDFAYLKKPIIYYQYEHGGDHHFDIEAPLADESIMNFGDTIGDEDMLIDKIIKYIDNDCEMEEEYKLRVDNFFKYTDKNNSKRVYEWVYKH
ncbi:hypothetical protein TL18_04810 [Methanobrevibacter sp. YE315]|uniref:CDP-glycerol glycerophosphotransferase family protein n=1 Tax=Methanobrevibacter sp. YE315 TaxID=1609968 RepID=UPI000764D7C0|nr:hypothetical protein TL18_04810 [Methanobrevibacter sp. YE315]